MSDHTLLPFFFSLSMCIHMHTLAESGLRVGRARASASGARFSLLMVLYACAARPSDGGPSSFHAAPRGARMLALWAQAPLPGGNPPRTGTRLGRRPRLWSSPSLAHSLPALPPKFQDTFSKKFNPGRKPSDRRASEHQMISSIRPSHSPYRYTSA